MSTPAFFAAKQTAFEETYQNGWEQTRFLAYVMLKTVDSKRKIKRPSDVVSFPWDSGGGKKFKKMTKEDKEALKRFDEEADIFLQKHRPKVWAKILEERKKAENGG